MDHKFFECNCNRTNCIFCDGGLAHCTICNGFEGTLTSECCGRKITEEEEHKIYEECSLDFRDGQWVQKSNRPNSKQPETMWPGWKENK